MRVPIFPILTLACFYVFVVVVVIAILVGGGPATTFCLYLSGLIQLNVTETLVSDQLKQTQSGGLGCWIYSLR